MMILVFPENPLSWSRLLKRKHNQEVVGRKSSVVCCVFPVARLPDVSVIVDSWVSLKVVLFHLFHFICISLEIWSLDALFVKDNLSARAPIHQGQRCLSRALPPIHIQGPAEAFHSDGQHYTLILLYYRHNPPGLPVADDVRHKSCQKLERTQTFSK